MTLLVLLLLLGVLCGLGVVAFTPYSAVTRRRDVKMEYIPDGLSKEQWEKLKKKEIEDAKNKNLGAVGITKFKSRSFEAWQKSGQSHLFPVDASVPIDQRPYMQRVGGTADGTDLKAKGLFGKGQAKEAPKLQVDEKYEKLEKEGKLRSAPFTIPWTASEAAKLSAKAAEEKKKERSGQPAGNESAAPKKTGFLGLF